MRLRRVDAFILAIALPIWAVLLAFHLYQVAAGRPTVWHPLVGLESARDAEGHPVVRWAHPDMGGGRALMPGDVLLRVGPDDLAGATRVGIATRILQRAQSVIPVPVAVRRGDAVVEVALDVRHPHPIGIAPVWATLTSLAFVGTGVLLLLRARAARAARPLFLALVSAQLFFASNFPGPPWQTYTVMVSRALGGAMGGPCYLQALLLLVPETAPRTRLGLWWPWLLAPLVLALHASTLFEIPFSMEFAFRWVDPVAWGALALSMLLVLTRSLRLASPDGRRRIKWVAYACFLLYVPRALQSALALLGYGDSLDNMLLALSAMVMPACLLIAVGRHHLLDIDRLISVTASYTILAVLALGAVLVGFPRIAALASGGLGLDPTIGQLFVGLGLAGVIVPAHRRLRPQIDRVFFAERYALERGVVDLLRELSGSAGPEALYTRTGERLDALVRPDSCVAYVRTGDAFAPAFVRGRVMPVALQADGPLAAALARRTAPLVTEAWQRGRLPVLGPFDRAALDTLGAAVVLPVRRGDALVAFVSLGAKRSGDIYTQTDLALLEAIARKMSDELVRFDLADIVARGREMEEALRRYVPAAVRAQLARGGVEPAECEVSVLFVDIRGYTSFAAARGAADVFTTVNRYAEAVSTVARDRGGAIAEFSGDGMMVIFGAPDALATKERAAVEAGRQILDAMAALPPDRPGSPPLSVGVGIATGPAFVGDVRSADRRIWTAIGDTVNLAARLQQLTRTLDAAMVIDTPTWRGARYVAADFVSHEQTAIRGRSEPENLWVLPVGRGDPSLTVVK